MRRFSIVLAIILFVSLGVAGCGGENMGNVWVDTQGEGYPDANEDEFVPTFIRENEKSLDKLAEMMLSHNFDFSIKLREDEVIIVIRKKHISTEEANNLRNEIENNVKLVTYASTLLEFQYVELLYRGSSDGDGILIDFSDINSAFGPVARTARYIPEDVLESHPRKEEYLRRLHVVGNWFYITEGRI